MNESFLEQRVHALEIMLSQVKSVQNFGGLKYPTSSGQMEYKTLRKQKTQTVNNSTTLVDDDTFSFWVRAGEIWQWDLDLILVSQTTSDFKIGITFPSGSIVSWHWQGFTEANAHSSFFLDNVGPGVIPGLSVNQLRYPAVKGAIFPVTTPGLLQIQWAQNTAQVHDTQVLQGSVMKLWRTK